jgi:hypothetical protein
MKLFLKMLLLAAVASATVALAQVSSKYKDIVVLQPQDLPQDARIAGQSMDLHSLGNGRTYLYIEQQQLGRLVILDVTDPARIKQVGFTSLQIPAAFYFSSPLGDFADLVCFRDHPGFAVMNFKNPKNPELTTSSALAQGDLVQAINVHGLLMTSVGQPACGESPQDYNIVDSSHPQAPRVLDTVRNVQKTLVRAETGTTFLLGEDGLTVVRRPTQEATFLAESTYTN